MTTASLTRARTATLVVVGAGPRLVEAATVLCAGEDASALRIVLISTESEVPPVDPDFDVVAIGGLKPEYVNNAIAAVRLSSLPTVVWWRGGPPEGLDGVASLADRVVLDGEDPWPLWGRAPSQFENAAITDLRWARLTQWRAAMAHFLDLPEVRRATASLSRLSISGADRAQCALFAGWLESSLGWKGRVEAEFADGGRSVPIDTVTLAGEMSRLTLGLHASGACLDTEARIAGQVLASRVISLGDQSLAALLSEELRVRSRDLAFERALVSTLASTPGV